MGTYAMIVHNSFRAQSLYTSQCTQSLYLAEIVKEMNEKDKFGQPFDRFVWWNDI